MTIRMVRLGTPRHPDEGTRIGTVRRPPRGVPKAEMAAPDASHALELLAALSNGSSFSVGCYCKD